jgi:hypothetical protein
MCQFLVIFSIANRLPIFDVRIGGNLTSPPPHNRVDASWLWSNRDIGGHLMASIQRQ